MNTIHDKCEACGLRKQTYPLWVGGAIAEQCGDCWEATIKWQFVCGICGDGPSVKWDGIHHLCEKCPSHRAVRMERIRPCHHPECGKPAFEFDDTRSWDEGFEPECNCCADMAMDPDMFKKKEEE